MAEIAKKKLAKQEKIKERDEREKMEMLVEAEERFQREMVKQFVTFPVWMIDQIRFQLA